MDIDVINLSENEHFRECFGNSRRLENSNLAKRFEKVALEIKHLPEPVIRILFKNWTSVMHDFGLFIDPEPN